AIGLALIGSEPASDAVGPGRSLRPRHAELRGCVRVERQQQQQYARGQQQKPECRLAPPGQGCHGHFTEILLENCAPKLLPGARPLKNASPGLEVAALVSPGRASASLHAGGALTSVTGSFSARAKSTKYVPS